MVVVCCKFVLNELITHFNLYFYKKTENSQEYKKPSFLTNTEKELHKKLVAARIRISKMKNKVKKLSANVKAAKRLHQILQYLIYCTSTAK